MIILAWIITILFIVYSIWTIYKAIREENEYFYGCIFVLIYILGAVVIAWAIGEVLKSFLA